MTRCRSHCDHCFPDDIHSCRRPEGHSGLHSCTPSDSDIRDDQELLEAGEFDGAWLIGLGVVIVVLLVLLAVSANHPGSVH